MKFDKIMKTVIEIYTSNKMIQKFFSDKAKQKILNNLVN